MSEALIVFVSSFVSVFALGFQSLNVNQGRFLWASATSAMICTGTLFLYRSLPTAGWLPIAAYYLGCNAGILTSMWLHPRLKAWWDAGSSGGGRDRKGQVPARPAPWPAPPPRKQMQWPRLNRLRPACSACGLGEGAPCPRLVCERWGADEHADVTAPRLH